MRKYLSTFLSEGTISADLPASSLPSKRRESDHARPINTAYFLSFIAARIVIGKSHLVCVCAPLPSSVAPSILRPSPSPLPPPLPHLIVLHLVASYTHIPLHSSPFLPSIPLFFLSFMFFYLSTFILSALSLSLLFFSFLPPVIPLYSLFSLLFLSLII